MQNKVQKCKLEGQLETGWFRYLKIAPFFLLGVAVAFEKQLCKIAPKFAWGILPKVYLSQPVLIKL